MDELDRMYRRLVQNIRSGFPDLVAAPFEVSQIYQQLIPYRVNRRELEIDSNEVYELTLLQLLAGVRGLLVGDQEMQRALRVELESSNPDLTAFRGYATSTVRLNPDALRALDAQPVPRSMSDGMGAPAQRSATGVQAAATRATEELPVGRLPRSPDHPQRGSTSGVASVSLTDPPTSLHPTNMCRYCGGELPEGRDVSFCPHCGQNLTIKHCPACSTELEMDWHFCITCGRQVE